MDQDLAPDLPSEKTSPIRLRDYQLDTIAQLSCFDANSPEQISTTTGVPVKTVINLLKGGQNKSFDTIRAAYQQSVMKNFHGATMRMIDRMPKAEAAIERAIDSDDVKVAADNAWKVIDRVVPLASKRSDSQEGSVSFIINNPQVHNELNQTVSDVRGLMRGLKGYLSDGASTTNHTVIGSQALPISPAQLEVGDGESLPDQSETLDNLNLIPLEDERI